MQISMLTRLSSAFYIPIGICITGVILYGYRFISPVVIASFLANLILQLPLIVHISKGISLVLMCFLARYLYDSFKDRIKEKFEYQHRLFLVFLIAWLSPLISTLVNLYILQVNNFIPDEQSFFANSYNWYLGDVLAILIFLPLGLNLQNLKIKPTDLIGPLIAIGISYLYFIDGFNPYLFLIFLAYFIPSLLKSAISLNLTLLVIVLIFNYFLNQQIGPLSMGSYNENMFSLQVFILSNSIVALALEGFDRAKQTKSSFIPLLFLCIVFGGVYLYYQNQRVDTRNIIFKNVANNYLSIISTKFENYENSLIAAAAFIKSSEVVTEDEWREFYNSIPLSESHSGAYGIFFVQKDNHGVTKTYMAPRNVTSFDNIHNVLKNPSVDLIIRQSKYRHEAVLSDRVQFEINGAFKDVFFYIYPVVRESDIYQWIIIPLDLKEFFATSVKTNFSTLDIDVYESEIVSPKNLIYSNVIDERLRDSQRRDSKLSHITVGHSIFTINWNETFRYITPGNTQNSLFILISIILTTVVAAFLSHFKDLSLKAQSIADKTNSDLKDSEKKFKLLFENLNDAVILFNEDQIIDCNPECIELFKKRNKYEVLNTPLFALISKNNYDDLSSVEIFKNKLEEVKYKRMIKFDLLLNRGKEDFFAEIHLHYIELNKTLIYQCVIRDITDRKDVEKTLRKSKVHAEDVANVKASILSTVAHEIRTPLNGIIGLSDIILTQNKDAEISDNLRTLKYSADNLLQIVNDVLDYSKIEAGKIEVKKDELNLKVVCENLYQLHKKEASRKGLNFNFELDEKIPEHLIGDELKNVQILNNLLHNAIKFTDKGTITLEVNLLKQKGNNVIVEFVVQDTGIGIDLTKRDDLFNEFTQVHEDRKIFQGTGLGLSIVKKLVQIQNGSISVDSKPNQGTTFKYALEFGVKKSILPKIENKSPDLQSTNSASNSVEMKFKNQKILLVEDNQVNIIVTKKFLEKWGLSVDVALNGLEAIKSVKAKDYSLILMDLHMPIMDGFEATKTIRTFNQDIPIIGLSADVMSDSISNLISKGMNDFVTKPFKPNDFHSVLMKYLK